MIQQALRPAAAGPALAFVLSTAACTAAPTPAPDQPGMAVPLATTKAAAIEKAVSPISSFPIELRQKALELVARNVDELGVTDLIVDDVQLQGIISSHEDDAAADCGVRVFVHSPSLALEQLKPVLGTFNDYLDVEQEPYLSRYGYPEYLVYRALRRININLPDTVGALEQDCLHIAESVY